MWLPALGAVFFVAAGIAWAMCPSAPVSDAHSGETAAAATAAPANTAQVPNQDILRARQQLEAAKAAAQKAAPPSPH